MSSEIEFKFLITNDNWKSKVVARLKIKQGYITSDKKLTSRVRIVESLDTGSLTGYLTFKGEARASDEGASECEELEYEIPLKDAEYLFNRTTLKIHKIRNIVPIENTTLKWEIDEYTDKPLDGLVVAELEIKKGQPRAFKLPDWLGDDVSNDFNYKNVNLAVQASNQSQLESVLR